MACVRFIDYYLSELRITHLDVALRQESRLPLFSDKIDTIIIKQDNETIQKQEILYNTVWSCRHDSEPFG
jgi:hypothetical protein